MKSRKENREILKEAQAKLMQLPPKARKSAFLAGMKLAKANSKKAKAST